MITRKEKLKEIQEFNMMSIFSNINQQDRDDSTEAQRRFPLRLLWENATLHNTQLLLLTMDSKDNNSNVSLVDLNEPITPHKDLNRITDITIRDQEIPDLQEIIIQDLEQLAEIDDSNTLNNSTPELSEEEYSNDNKPDDLDIATFNIDIPNPIKKIILYIAKRHKEVFPKIARKRRLHPHQFDCMLSELQTMF